jgi:hypothetical protein
MDECTLTRQSPPVHAPKHAEHHYRSVLSHKKNVYSITYLVDNAILVALPPNETLPTPKPMTQVADQVNTLLANLKPRNICEKEALRPPKTPTSDLRRWNTVCWARRFDYLSFKLLGQGRGFEDYNKYDKRLWMGQVEGEEKTRQGPNSLLKWEVVRVFVANHASVGCILADNLPRGERLSSTDLLRSELICALTLACRQIRKHRDLLRLTVRLSFSI